MTQSYTFKNSARGATLQIFDEIGADGVCAADFKKQLDAVVGSTLALEINSYGGDVFTAVSMFNMLKGSGKTINVKVMGVAASAASLIAMAGRTIEMPSNTFMMIHRASTATSGSCDELRKAADALEKVEESITATYVAKTGLAAEKVKVLLANETWLTAEEAVAMGFATKVTQAIDAHAAFSVTRAQLPARVAAIFQARRPRLRTARPSLADEIEALCEVAKQSQLAAGFISSGKTLPQIRAALLTAYEATERTATTSRLWAAHTNNKGVLK